MRGAPYTNDDGLRDFFVRERAVEPTQHPDLVGYCAVTAVVAFAIGLIVGIFAVVSR